MTYIETLEKFGHIIQEYFEYITPKGESYYLLVDEFLFETFLEKMQQKYKVSPQQVYSAYRNIKCSFQKNPHVALAIAAYQVMVFYMLESNSSSDAYNDKLFSSVAYKGFTYQEYWYQDTAPYAPDQGCALQERMWALVDKTFNVNNIPSHTRFGDRNRYVQYPKSQNLLGSSMRTFRIRYADRFIELGLEPNQGITFDIFEGLVFNRNNYNYVKNTMLRRLVFSFYCMWDGRSYREIIERRKALSKEEIEARARDEFCIQLEPIIKFYMNKEFVDLSKGSLNEKYLWKFDENSYLTRRGSLFLKDSNYNDWLPSPISKPIDPDEEVIILTNQNRLPSYVEHYCKTGEIDVIKAGIYRILILNFKDRTSFDRFRIPVKAEPYFSLVGGLKIKRNTYYSFALPIIKFSEHKYDKKIYKSIYVDSKEYPVVNGIVQLPEKMAPGKHCIKLLNSWDSSEMYFSVEAVSAAPIPETHGWILNETNKETKPSLNIENTVISGLTLLGKLEWIERKPILLTKIDNENLRPFLQQIDKLENRFAINKLK